MPGVTGPTGPAGFDPSRYNVTPSTHVTNTPELRRLFGRGGR